jgi:anti-anti-sigma factor
MIDVREKRWSSLSVLQIQGSLRVPVGGELREVVHTLLTRRGRRILLDLSRVSAVDAGGVGEVVHVYNMTIAAQSALRIVAASARVRELLRRAGLFDLLSRDGAPWRVPSPADGRVA